MFTALSTINHLIKFLPHIKHSLFTKTSPLKRVGFALAFLLSLCSMHLLAQQTTTFMRTFSAPGMNGGLSLAETADGGFIGTGQHEYAGAQSCDVYVYKVNGCGYPEWFKTYGGADADGGKQVLQTSDGGYILAGLTYSGVGLYDILLQKIDGSGNVQWINTYGGAGNDYGLYAVETSDHGFIISGFADGLGFGQTDAVVIKTDAFGNTQWRKFYGGIGSDWGDYVEQTPDGGYIVVGYTTSFGAGSYDIYLLRLDAAGNLLWSKTYGGPGGDASSAWGISGKLTSDGGIMLCANTDNWGAGGNDLLLIKTDSLGSLQWAKTYGGAGDDQPRFANETADKGFIISGYTTSFGAGGVDAYLVKTDSTGIIQWSHAYGGADEDKGMMVRQSPKDHGYALSTITSSFGADYFDPIFMKTDSVGHLGCSEVNCATTVTNVSPAVGSGGTEMIAPLTIGHPGLAVNNYSPNDHFICLHCGIVPTFTQSTATACVGNTIYFYNTTNPGAECTEWLVNGVSNGVHDTLALTFGMSGLQRVQLVASCGNSTDTNTISLNISAFNAPVASYNNTTVCNGQASSFTDSSSSTSGTINAWLWDFGDSSPSNTQTNPTYVYPNPGTYNATLTVTTTNGCADSTVRSIVVHPLPVVNFDTLIVCRGDSVQFHDLSSILNTSSLQSWAWDFGDGSPVNNNQNPLHLFSSAGVYNVKLKVYSNFGCTDSLTKAITVTPAFTIHASFGNSSTCSGGTVFLGGNPTATGGAAPYTYAWSPATGLNNTSIANPTGVITADITYSLTVTASDGCSTSDTVHVSFSSGAVHATAGFGNSSLCTSGNLLLGGNPTATGGTGPYVYHWLHAVGLTDSLIANPVASLTDSATFVVWVIDGLGCQDVDSIFVSFNPNGPLTEAGFGNSSLCTGGAVILGGAPTGSGGVSPYTYRWLPVNGLNDSTIANPTATVSGNAIYAVLVTDSAGCQDLDSISILFSSIGPFADAGFGSSSICTGGMAQLGGNPTGFGGVGPYTYSWLPIGGLTNPFSANPTATITGDTAYAVIVTDSVGCMNVDSVYLHFSASGPFANAGFGHDTMCTGGVVILGGAPTATGGIAPYTYSWNPSIGINDTASANPTATINADAMYAVIIKDSTGCENVDSVFLHFNSSGPFADAGFGNSSLCTGGSILLGGNPTATGGIGPFSYLWLPALGIDNPTDANPTATVSNDATYAVLVTDSTGCQNVDSVFLFFNSAGPFADAGFGSGALCTSGTALLGGAPTANGGIAPYSYVWVPANGINNITLANPTASITSNAVYAVIVSDSIGCQNIDSVHLIYSSSGPFAEAGFGSDTVCTAGVILLGGSPTGSGGILPYVYNWLPASHLNDTTIANPTATLTDSTHYVLIVRDSSGCQDIDSVFIRFNTGGPFANAGFGSNSMCTSGSIMIGGNPTATGGVSPYNYAWVPSTDLNDTTLANPTATILSNTAYAVIVKDVNGCENIDTVHLIYNASAVHAEAGFASDSLCTGGNILIGGNPTATSGVPPYSYLWIPSNGLNNATLANPTANTSINVIYTVLVTDGNGCEDVDTVMVVFNPTGPHVDAGLGDGSLCIGQNILLGGSPSANGGTSPYVYLWSPSTFLNNTSIANPTAVNVTNDVVYYLTVFDGSGCSNIDSAVVTIIGTGVTSDFSAAPVFGYNQLTVLFANQSMGPGLSYFWNFGDGGTSTDINPSHTYNNGTDSTNHYTVTLITTDMYGCADTAIFASLVNVTSSSTVTFTNVFTPNGDGINDVFSFNTQYMESADVSIFNRWGQLVFESNAPNSQWDGRTASGVVVTDGVYYYLIKGKGLDGKTYEKTGYIQVIR